MFAFKTTKPNRNTLFTNTKREKKDSKFIFAKHVIKGNVDILTNVFDAKSRDNVLNKGFEKRVSDERKRIEESSETTFNRREIN